MVFPLESVSVEPSVPAGISFDPKEEVVTKITLRNRSDRALHLDEFEFRVARTRALVGTPESIWDSRFTNVEELSRGVLPAWELAAHATVELPIRFVPGKYGYFSVMLMSRSSTTEAEYRAAGMAVVYPPMFGRGMDSPLLTTASNKARAGDYTEFPVLARYGMRWIRFGLAPEIDAMRKFDWSQVNHITAALRENHLLMLTDITEWHGESPSIGGKPVAYFNGRKANVMPRVEDLELYADQVSYLVKNYRDVVPAGYLRNEPWEGGSITFYHGTGKFYRQWLEVAARAAHREAPDFPILASDAITNFEDNILMAGSEHLVDIVSHHSDLPMSRGAIESAAVGKPAWETEDWMSHYDAYLVANLTMKLAHGYLKSNPGDAGLYTTNPGQDGRRMWNQWSEGPTLPAPAGQAVSIWLHFIDGTRFDRELSQDCLPWMFLFSAGSEPSAKHAAVVVGRIKAYGYGYTQKAGDIAWPDVTAFGHLCVEDRDRALSVYDFSGNPIAADGQGKFQIPLNEDAYYVVSRKGAGDVAAKLTAAQAKYAGAGFQISLLDFTWPLHQRPPIRVTVKNAIRAVADAKVKLTAPNGWVLAANERELKNLQPGETRTLEFAVTKSIENSGNRYPFTLEVSSAAGNDVLRENLHVAAFRRGTINVDGKLDDWEKIGAIPVTLSGSAAADDPVEKMWYPFLGTTSPAQKRSQVRFAGAWDDTYFYLCAEVFDPAEQLRPSMTKGVTFATHGQGLEYLYWGTPAFPGTVGDALKIAFDVHRAGAKNDPWLPAEFQRRIDARFEHLSADYEYDLYQAAQNKIEPGYDVVLARHLDRLKNPPDENYRKKWPPFEDPTLVATGPAFPEIWRLMAPGVPRGNYYPFSPRHPRDQGVVTEGKLVVVRDGATLRYEAAIPWSELSEVKPEVGKEVRFSFIVLDDGKRTLNWSDRRSASAGATTILHPTWQRTEAIETVWSFQDALPQ